MSSPAIPRAKVIIRVVMAAIAVAIFAADQVMKTLVDRHIPEGTVIRMIPGLFNLTNTKNSGAVFGLFQDAHVWWKTPLLVVVSAGLLIAVLAMVARVRNLHWQTSVGIALILGGALSNLFDRVRAGLVEDSLDFYFRSFHWYTFNLADSAIVVGTAFIILQVLRSE